VQLPTLRCAQGSTALELFHLHIACFIPGASASGLHYQAYLIKGLVRWNQVEKVNLDLPGFEVSQTKHKPIADIATWAYCFARYTAAMATKYPTCTVGFMAHQVTVLKVYMEAEDPAWRLYDEAYREKMAATGCREWKGMDVQLYQSVCTAGWR
jgi:hypothetical protein